METKVTFQYLLPGTAPEVSLYFSNFHLFGKHHPYMIKVIDLENTLKTSNTFRVYESLKLWGLIPMKPIYDVSVEIIESEKKIRYTSEVSKGVFLEIDYTFIEDSTINSVNVIESMTLKGYPIINTVFIGLLKKSRKLLFESIREAQSEKYMI